MWAVFLKSITPDYLHRSIHLSEYGLCFIQYTSTNEHINIFTKIIVHNNCMYIDNNIPIAWKAKNMYYKVKLIYS